MWIYIYKYIQYIHILYMIYVCVIIVCNTNVDLL